MGLPKADQPPQVGVCGKKGGALLRKRNIYSLRKKHLWVIGSGSDPVIRVGLGRLVRVKCHLGIIAVSDSFRSVSFTFFSELREPRQPGFATRARAQVARF